MTETFILLKIKLAARAVLNVITQPLYLLITILGALLLSGSILWSLNLDLLKYILLDAPISIGGKLEFFLYGYQSVFTTYSGVQSGGIAVISVLFGINVALFVYAIRNQAFKLAPKKSGIGATGLALISGGCVACGTSLITPLLVSLGVTSSVASSALLREISTILIWLGSLLLLYSIYQLSIIAGTVLAVIKQKQ